MKESVRRRLTLQLTPLLDLLLIVMFAQYLEMQIIAKQESERIEARHSEAAAQTEEMRDQLAAARKQLAEIENRQMDADRVEHQDRQSLGKLVGELFRIPASTLQKITKQRTQDEAGLTPDDVAALTKEFQRLASARSDQVVDHLLTFAEMKKRFDVWELYIRENGALIVRVGSHERQLRTGVIETPEQFSDELFNLYKLLPQTKSIVLMLVSYGDARFNHRLAAIKGLPLASERMRADSGGAARFEYAVLGYRPESAPVD